MVAVGKVRWEVVGVVILPLSTLVAIAAAAELAIHAAIGTHADDRVTLRRYSEELLVRDIGGNGRLMLKGNSWLAEGAAEPGDNDQEDEVMEEPLGRPSILSSINPEFPAPISSLLLLSIRGWVVVEIYKARRCRLCGHQHRHPFPAPLTQ
jgi:hypothetical protein